MHTARRPFTAEPKTTEARHIRSAEAQPLRGKAGRHPLDSRNKCQRQERRPHPLCKPTIQSEQIYDQ